MTAGMTAAQQRWEGLTVTLTERTLHALDSSKTMTIERLLTHAGVPLDFKTQERADERLSRARHGELSPYTWPLLHHALLNTYVDCVRNDWPVSELAELTTALMDMPVDRRMNRFLTHRRLALEDFVSRSDPHALGLPWLAERPLTDAPVVFCTAIAGPAQDRDPLPVCFEGWGDWACDAQGESWRKALVWLPGFARDLVVSHQTLFYDEDLVHPMQVPGEAPAPRRLARPG